MFSITAGVYENAKRVATYHGYTNQPRLAVQMATDILRYVAWVDVKDDKDCSVN